MLQKAVRDVQQNMIRDYKHVIAVVGDRGHVLADSHRLETCYMNLIDITAIISTLHINALTAHLKLLVPHLIFLSARFVKK